MKYIDGDDYQKFKDVAGTDSEIEVVNNLVSKCGVENEKEVYSLLIQNAVSKDEVDWVAKILKHEPDLNILNKFNSNAITYALNHGNKEVLQLLQQYYLTDGSKQQEMNENISSIVKTYVLPDPDAPLKPEETLDYLNIFYSGVTNYFPDFI